MKIHHRQPGLIGLLFVWLVSPPLAALSLSDLDYDPKGFARLTPAELGFRLDRSFENPFDPNEIAVEAELTGPGGASLVVPGYYHQEFAVDHQAGTITKVGEAHWMLRLTPMEAGTHRIVIRASVNGGKPQILETLEVKVARAPASAEGFVRIDPDNRSQFSRSESGRTFWPLGYNIFHLSLPPFKDYEPGAMGPKFKHELKPTLFLSLIENGEITPEARYAVYLDLMTRLKKTADAGATALRIRLDSWWQALEVYPDAPIAGESVAEAGQRLKELFPVGRYEAFHAWLADEMLRYAESKDMAAILCMWNGQAARDKHWGMTPYWAPGEEDEDLIKRKVRYFVARWTASPATWTWEYFNEVSGKQNLPVEIKGPFWSGVTEYFRSIDPYDHPINNGREHVDYYDAHRYDPDNNLVPTYRDARKLSRKNGMPFMFGELGIGVASVQSGLANKDLTGNSYRQWVWRMMTSGNSGLLFWRTNRMDTYDLYDEVFTLPRQMIDRLDFANHAWDFPAIEPGDSGMEYRAMRNKAGTTLVYAQRTPIVEDDLDSLWQDKSPTEAASTGLADMPPGLYRVTWYRPTDGDVLLETTLSTMDARLLFPTPAGVSRDAVLLIERVE